MDTRALDVDQLAGELDARLAAADAALAARFPGEPPGRQPVHTVYVPADRYTAGLCRDWGERALAALAGHDGVFRDLVGDDGIAARVRAKLAAEPVEDLRIDFEDGYGARGDEAEDADAAVAAASLAASVRAGTTPPFRGIRIKSFEAPTRRRGLRALAGFAGALAPAAGGLEGLVVTLPKVTSAEQVEAMVYTCERLEAALGVAAPRFEIQVETPQSILGPDGSALVARMVLAGTRVLPGVGPAPGPAADPLRGDLRVLPGRPRPGGRAAARLPRRGRLGHPGRARHRPRAGRLLPAGRAVRRRQRGGGAGRDRARPGGTRRTRPAGALTRTAVGL